MSGYLERLAARAGGAPAAAEPRLPSRFEPGGDAVTDAAAPAPAGPREPVAHGEPAERSHREEAASPRGDGHAPAAAGEPGRPLVARRAAMDAAARGAESASFAPVPTPPPARGRAETDPAPAAQLAEAPLPRPPVIAVAPRRVEATPPPRAAPRQAAAARRDEASVTAAEPDVVNVTIARVEVRATVVSPAPTARTVRPPRDSESSLHDYLAGNRR